MPTPQVQKGILAAMKWWETELAAYKRPDDPEALQELQQHRQLIADVEAADCDDLRLEVNQLRSLLFRVQRRFEAFEAAQHRVGARRKDATRGARRRGSTRELAAAAEPPPPAGGTPESVDVESISADLVRRMFRELDVVLDEKWGEWRFDEHRMEYMERLRETYELLASMTAGRVVGEGSIPADVVRRMFEALGVGHFDEPRRTGTELLLGIVATLLAEEESIPVEMVRRTIVAEARPDLDFDNQHGLRLWEGGTLLHKAAKDGDVSMAAAVLALGGDVDAVDGDPYGGHFYHEPGYTPLLIAATEGHVDLMRVLLEAGADATYANGELSDDTALHKAAQRGHPAAIQLLIDAGADVNARDEGNMSPLEGALCCGRRNCLEPLLRAGATVDDEMLDEMVFSPYRSERYDSAWRYMDRVQAAGGYDQLVRTYRRVLTAPRSCLVKYLELRFGRPAPADIVPVVLAFWKPPGGG